MDTFEAIHTRKSVRRFLEKPVEDEKLQRILEAVRMAPSWGNGQCWRFIIVKDSRMKEAISELTWGSSDGVSIGENPAKRGIVEAPVLIVACADPSQSGTVGDISYKLQQYYMTDVGLAAQNLMLSARALGLGTVFVGVFYEEKLRNLLNIPSHIRVIGLFPLGYPRTVRKKGSPRKPLHEFVFHQKWK